MKFVSQGFLGGYFVTDQLPCYGKVTIKLLDDSARDDPEELTVLLEVASLMAKMRHPNVVRVYGLVVDDKDFVVGLLIEHFWCPLSCVLKEQVRVGVSPQTSVLAGLLCRHHWCCGGLMQSLCAGPALMTSRQCLPQTPDPPCCLVCHPACCAAAMPPLDGAAACCQGHLSWHAVSAQQEHQALRAGARQHLCQGLQRGAASCGRGALHQPQPQHTAGARGGCGC